MASSRSEAMRSKQEQPPAPPPVHQYWDGAGKRIGRAVLPGSPLPGYGVNGARTRHFHHRMPFRLPSLNASPTCSVDDLSMGEDPIMSNNTPAPLYTLPPASSSESTTAEAASGGYSNQNQAWRHQRKCESPGTYRKTLEQLATLRKQRPMLGSTSDYFSLTSSMCSDDGEYCPFDYEDTESNGSEYGWSISPTQMDELRSVAERVLQGHACGDEVRIKADLLDNICQQTRELERRNEELRQELEQLHFDTKRFMEKATTENEGVRENPNVHEWRNRDFAIVFDDNETDI